MQHDAAYNAGYYIGQLIAAILPMVFILIAALDLKRHGSNRNCLIALILVLGGYFIVMVGSIVTRDSPIQKTAMMVLMMFYVCILLAGIVLACVGLSEYRERRYRRGRPSGIVALCLAGVPLLLLFVAICTGAVRGYQRRAGGGLTEAAPPFVSAQYNFQCLIPSPWVPMDAARINPAATMYMIRSNPPMYFMIMAQHPGVETSLQTGGAVAAAKAHLESASSALDSWQESPMTLHGIDGTRIDADAELQGQPFSEVQWITVYHGFAYEIVAWTDRSNRQQLVDTATGLFENFQVLDPNQLAHAAGYHAVRDYHSISNGFDVAIAGTSWDRSIPRLYQTTPDAEFGVQRANGDAFVVIPLALNHHDPDLDMLTAAFLSRYNTQYPGDAILDQKSVTHGPLKGYSLLFTRTNSVGELRNRAEVLKGNGLAYLLIASTLDTDDSADARLQEVLTHVQFDPSPALPDLKELTTRERQTRADIFNAIGLAYFREKEYDKAFEYCKEARTQAPGRPIFALNTTDALIQTGRYREALDDLRGFIGKRDPDDKLKLRLAFLDSQTGDVDGALKIYGQAFDDGTRDDDYFALYIYLLSQSKQHDAAIARTTQYLTQNDTPRLQMLLATAYEQAGQVQKSIDVLLAQQQKYPEDSQLGIVLAETFVRAGRYAEALDQCTKLCEGDRGTSTTYFLKGRAEYGLKHYREAKASLEAAVERDPSNTQLKAFLDQVSGMLGEGSNTALEDPIDPVAIPASVLALPAGNAADLKETGSFGGYYKTYATGIEYQKGKEFKTTERRVIEVLDESGVTAFSTFEIPFDPLSEEIYVNELIVRDGSGAVVSTGTVSDYYVMDDTSSGEATQNKLVHIPVSGLRPGCEISLTLTRRDIGSPDGFDFTTHTFSKAFPVLHSTLFVRAPAGALKVEKSGNIAERKVGDGTCWWIDQPAVYRWEPLQPDMTNFLPSVCISDATASWKGVASDYLDSIRDRIAPDDDIRKAAAAKTAGLTKPEEKVAALTQFVQKDFTYTAIEFGRRARIPNKASTTLQNRYGDCKDHAVLLRALLEAAGVNADLVLVNAKSDLRKDMPSLDQFDHVIVYVPSLKGGTYIDCTDKDSNIGAGAPLGLAKKDVLLLDEKAPRLTAIPDYQPGSNDVVATRSVQIVNDADASVHEDVKLEGASAAFLREMLRHADPASRQSLLQAQLAASAPALELQDASFDNLDDPRQPLLVRAEYMVRGKFRRVGGQLIGQLPAVWERMFLGTEAVEKRATPFTVQIPVNIQSNVALTVPPDYKADPLPAAEFKEDFASCTETTREESAALKIDCDIHARTGQFPPTQYASYHDTLDKALGAIEPNVVLTAVGK
jgi:transglutaminase-like putative cysteine protease/tetratricopeptide (TPR) repeat protein